MGVVPSRAWRIGEPRSTPKGMPLKGVYRDTHWDFGYIAEGRSEDGGLAEGLKALAVRLSPHRDFFHRMRAEGGGAELFVGWFLNGNSGDVFKADLLAVLAVWGWTCRHLSAG